MMTLDEYIGQEPWDLLDPHNCNLYPCVIKDNYNFNNKARFLITDNIIIGNLILNDGKSIWSIGSNNPLNLEEIYDYAKKVKGIDKEFKHFSVVSRSIVPAKTHIGTSIVKDSRDEYEYIYDTNLAHQMKSSAYATHRRYTKKFNILYSENITVDVYHDDNDSTMDDELLNLYESWLDGAALFDKDAYLESAAFQKYRMLKKDRAYRRPLKLIVRYKGKVIGLSINDIVSANTAINLYFFCNLNLTGISHYLFYLTNKHLSDLGITELNFQEDRGSLGLRRFKKLLKPYKINELIEITVQ